METRRQVAAENGQVGRSTQSQRHRSGLVVGGQPWDPAKQFRGSNRVGDFSTSDSA